MPKYHKKPVVIEAVQWSGSLADICVLDGAPNRVTFAADGTPALLIHTLEGEMRAEVGDYIIRGVKGELYPCKPDIFEATYEAVAEVAAPTTLGAFRGFLMDLPICDDTGEDVDDCHCLDDERDEFDLRRKCEQEERD